VPVPETVFIDALIRDRVRHPPGAEAAAELGLPPGVPPPQRWQLRTLRASIRELADYSLSGIWYACRRARVRLRQARPRLFSPDPAYLAIRQRLLDLLCALAADPEHIVLVFLDEMGYLRWPQPAPTLTLQAPEPVPTTSPAGKEAKHRVAGMLDAWTGRVLFVDADVVGRDRLKLLYRNLDAAYPDATRIIVVQDNWPIHAHADLDEQLAALPRIERFWLPTAAWWLNPIEKLWRKLRQEVLRLHRLAGDWLSVHRAVRLFLRQFAQGSHALLEEVGLLGEGALARARRGLLPTTDLCSEK
jgi:transposase